MLRRLAFVLALVAAFSVAAAQITIFPVTGDGPDQIAKGADSATVNQIVELILPQATALHLDASTITFDLTALDGTGWAERASSGELPTGFELACVYVTGNDVPNALGGTYWNQTQVVPGGIAYHAATWDQIYLEYYGNGFSGVVPDTARVVTYPPIRLDAADELVPGSKGYFVCYQTFVLQLFSNFNFWDLQVHRADLPGQPIEHLYVQGNTCADFGAGTGLYKLDNGMYVHLIPKTLNAGTTGDVAASDGSMCSLNTSWLDVLGVLAVKINADHWGTSVANLQYTLVSSDAQF
ncbi:MAG: hypothetical protein R6W77_13665 [Trueperaceae bacterium]